MKKGKLNKAYKKDDKHDYFYIKKKIYFDEINMDEELKSDEYRYFSVIDDKRFNYVLSTLDFKNDLLKAKFDNLMNEYNEKFKIYEKYVLALFLYDDLYEIKEMMINECNKQLLQIRKIEFEIISFQLDCYLLVINVMDKELLFESSIQITLYKLWLIKFVKDILKQHNLTRNDFFYKEYQKNISSIKNDHAKKDDDVLVIAKIIYYDVKYINYFYKVAYDNIVSLSQSCDIQRLLTKTQNIVIVFNKIIIEPKSINTCK